MSQVDVEKVHNKILNPIRALQEQVQKLALFANQAANTFLTASPVSPSGQDRKMALLQETQKAINSCLTQIEAIVDNPGYTPEVVVSEEGRPGPSM